MKIFFVNHFYPKEIIGGSEIQCFLLAKYLAKRGHQTYYFAVRGLSEEKERKADGFNVYYLSKKGETKFRAFVRFYKFLKKEKPDICYIRIFRYLFFLSRIASFCKVPVVFNTSHINDCYPKLETFQFSFNIFRLFRSMRLDMQRRLNFFSLKKAKVITINKHQSRLLKEQHNIETTSIYNSMEDLYEENRGKKQKQIVWVNNIKARKRPELFIRLADALKDRGYKFLMIGYIQDKAYKNIIEESEKKNGDFKYLGGRSPAEVDKILAVSEIFAHTCEPEGFGNNFIQAWFNGCATVTLEFDPDEIMEKNNIGYRAGDFLKMVDIIRKLMYDDNLRLEIGKRAREYALANHSIEKNIILYENYFKNILINDKKNK